MHSKDLSELEGKARRDSMIRNLGDPIGVFFFGDHERSQGGVKKKKATTIIGNK